MKRGRSVFTPEFSSCLAPVFTRYVELKQALGRRFDTSARTLQCLDRFLGDQNYRDLNADIQIGAASADLCHFANISYRVGRSLKWDSALHSWSGDSEANALMHPIHRAPYGIPEKF